jgi:hypothetical protein
MQLKDLLPLVGVIVGALLTLLTGQLGQWLASRRDEKRAIARALSDLLEIRIRLLAVPKIPELLAKHFPIPPEAHTAMKIVFTRLIPPDADIGKRYGDAVTLVAACDPILGFRLRSQDIASPLLDTLRQLAFADGPSSAAAFANVETELMGHLKPHLDELIKEIAWLHGWSTWWKVRRRLDRPMELPEGFMEALKAQLSQLGRGQAEPQKQPATVPQLAMPAGFPEATLEAITSRVILKMKNPSAELDSFGGAKNGMRFRLRACADYAAGFTQSVQKFGDAPPVEERYKQETFLFTFFVSGTAVLDSLSMLIYIAAAQIRPSEFPMQKRQIKGINCKSVAAHLERAFPSEALTLALKQLIIDPRFHEWSEFRNVLAHRAVPGRTLYLSTGGSASDKPADWRVDTTGVKIDENLAPPRLAWLVGRLATLLAAADEFTTNHF